MQRAPSVERFGQVYLGAIALSALGWYLDWPALQARLAVDPRIAPFEWMLYVMLAFSILLPLLLWFLVTRRASVAAARIVAVLAALSVVRLLIDLPAFLAGDMARSSFALGAANTIASITAAALLFRRDARRWLGRSVEGDTE